MFLVQTRDENQSLISRYLIGQGPRQVDGSNPDEFMVSQQTRLYSEGPEIRVGVSRGSPHTGTATGFVNVSGYLVDVP